MIETKRFNILSSLLLGILISIILMSSRVFQNISYTLALDVLLLCLFFFALKKYNRTILLFWFLAGILLLDLVGFWVNKNVWLLLVSEILVVASTVFLLYNFQSLILIKKIGYFVAIILLISLISFWVEPSFYFNNSAWTQDSVASKFIDTTKLKNFVLKDENNKNVDPAIFLNKIVLIDFWFKGCKPCRIKENSLFELSNYFSDTSRFQIIMINAGSITSFQKFKEYNFPSSKIISLYDSGGVITNFYKIDGFPSEFILNKEGGIIKRQTGFIENGEFLYLKNSKKFIKKWLSQ